MHIYRIIWNFDATAQNIQGEGGGRGGATRYAYIYSILILRVYFSAEFLDASRLFQVTFEVETNTML